MESNTHQHKEKILSLIPPVVTYRNSIDGSYIPMDLPIGDRKASLAAFSKSGNNEDDKIDPPKDPCNFVLFTLFFLGFAGMLPATYLTTANEYWMYKFRNVSEGEEVNPHHKTPLQMAYATYVVIVMIIPAILFNILFSFIGHKWPMSYRARTYYWSLQIVFLLQFAFSLVNTDSWQGGFFAFLMGSQIFLTFGMALGMAMMPIANKFPKHYFVWHISGQGLEGVLTALIRLLSVSLTTTQKSSGQLYFGCGVVLMTVAIVAFEISTRTKFYKYYVTKVEKEDADKKANTVGDIGKVFKKVWKVVVVAVTNIVNPAGVLTTIVASQYADDKSNLWAKTYFVTVCTYLIPSVAGLIGRTLSQNWGDIFSIRFLMVISVGKMIIFTPLLALCNAIPKHHLPVVFGQDYQYALIMFTSMLLSGYLSNVTMVLIAKLNLSPEQSELAFRIVMLFIASSAVIIAPMSIVTINVV